MNASRPIRSVYPILFQLAAVMSGAARCLAGTVTDLNFLADSAGDLTPPFSAAVTSYTQTHRFAELLFWSQPLDLEAAVDVRANEGSWQRIANRRTLAAGRTHVAVVRASGTVAAWGGNNDSGQSTVPAGLTNVVSVACGDRFRREIHRGVEE